MLSHLTTVQFTVQSNKSPLFSNKLSICFRWIDNGCLEEHFITLLHVKFTNADTIMKALISSLTIETGGSRMQ